MTGSSWDPESYERFAAQRLRPALDLIARIPTGEAGTVVDLGCGPGRVTGELAARWPGAAVTGVDSSPQMLDRARARHTGIEWVEGRIEDWEPEEPVDVVFSNAALHFLSDHQSLFPRLFAAVGDGGTLAVQMPLSWHQPTHQLIRATLHDLGIGSPGLRSRLEMPPVGEPVWYWRILSAAGGEVDVWTTTYLHVLDGEDALPAWMAGAGLRPVLEDLGEAERDRFLDEYTARLTAAYPPLSDGTTLLPYPRLFLIAVRQASARNITPSGGRSSSIE